MIEAEIKGKLGSNFSRAHERSEDLLTSTVFGLLRYVPYKEGLGLVLSAARRVEMDSGGIHLCDISAENTSWLQIEHATTYQLGFWPSLGKFGQPDILLKLFDKDGNLFHKIIIEVKLYSPKSGEAEEGEEYIEEVPDKDQLVKYWQGLTRQEDKESVKTVIYLTSHYSAPMEELQGAITREKNMRLAWLSWRDVWRAVTPKTPGKGHTPLRDLSALLAHRGFKGFTGFDLLPFILPSRLNFWDLFNMTNFRVWPQKGFWRINE